MMGRFKHATGMGTQTNDEMIYANKITVSDTVADEYGPVAEIHYEQTALTMERHERQTARKVDFARQAGGPNVEIIMNYPGGSGSHPMSTLQMGDSATHSVCDLNHECWTVPRLYVCDASCLPNGLGGSNPARTINAFASRCCLLRHAEVFPGEVGRPHLALVALGICQRSRPCSPQGPGSREVHMKRIETIPALLLLTAVFLLLQPSGVSARETGDACQGCHFEYFGSPKEVCMSCHEGALHYKHIYEDPGEEHFPKCGSPPEKCKCCHGDPPDYENPPVVADRCSGCHSVTGSDVRGPSQLRRTLRS